MARWTPVSLQPTGCANGMVRPRESAGGDGTDGATGGDEAAGAHSDVDALAEACPSWAWPTTVQTECTAWVTGQIDGTVSSPEAR